MRIMQLTRGHTKGDTVVWLPEERVLFSDDLVEYGAPPYTGDAYLLGLARHPGQHHGAEPWPWCRDGATPW